MILGCLWASLLDPRGTPNTEIRIPFLVLFLEGVRGGFGAPFSLINHVFYEGVFLNLAFCSRVGLKGPAKGTKR